MILATIPTPVPTRRYGMPRARTELVVWHATAGGTARSSAEWIARPDSQAGYHYLIERDGTVLASTPHGRVAWHAGVSAWPVPAGGVPAGASVNARSLGIAFANRNDGERVTPAQIVAACQLAAALAAVYPAVRDLANHIRHRDCAPGRKTDPTPEGLDWAAFRAQLAAALR